MDKGPEQAAVSTETLTKPQETIASKPATLESAEGDRKESIQKIEDTITEFRGLSPETGKDYGETFEAEFDKRAIPGAAQSAITENLGVEFDGQIDQAAGAAEASLTALNGTIGVATSAERKTGIEAVAVDLNTNIGIVDVGVGADTSGAVGATLGLPAGFSLSVGRDEKGAGVTVGAEYTASTKFGDFTIAPTRLPDGQITFQAGAELANGSSFGIDYSKEGGALVSAGHAMELGKKGLGSLEAGVMVGKEERGGNIAYGLKF